MKEIKLLLVEDDIDYREVVKDSLELMGNYNVFAAKDGQEGYEGYKTFLPDIIVSDVDMPLMSGLEMVTKIREEDADIPILFASARYSARDLANGFKLEIDDYIKKPYLPGELELHIKSILRRVAKVKQINKEESLSFPLGSYLFDLKGHCLRRGEEALNLTVREAQILQLLYEEKGELVKRKDILMQFWGADDYYASRSLDVFISNLRKYLEQDDAVQIVTIRGEGLILSF